MSSDEEYDFGGGIDDDCQNTFSRTREEVYYNNLDEEEEEEDAPTPMNEFDMPKYDKDVNKKVKEMIVQAEDADSNSNAPLDDLMELLGTDATDPPEEGKITKEVEKVKESRVEQPPPKKIDSEDERGVLTEKSSGIRIVKSTFSSDSELNMRLGSDYGQYFRLTDLAHRQEYIQKNKIDWYTVVVIGSKSETKCSAKGNNYLIWNVYDLNNLEREQDISLFLFGNAYKAHWKSSEFEVFAISKADFFDDSKSNAPSNSKFGAKPAGGKQKAAAAVKKFSISVRNDNQLVRLGFAKDISACQSFKKTQVGSNEHNTEGSQRCKNLVNLRVSKYCVYHCKKLDSGFKAEKFINKTANSRFGGGAANFNNPNRHFVGKSRVAEAVINEDGIHVYKPKIDIKSLPVKKAAPPSQSKYHMSAKSEPETIRTNFIENPDSNSSIVITSLKDREREKMKKETLLSLTYKQNDSPIVAQMTFKSTKASDKEYLAKLSKRDVDESELKSIRKAAAVENRNDYVKHVDKGLSNLFSSKALLPNEQNCNNSVSAKKLVELKNYNLLHNIKTSHEEMKAYNLSTMSSHRDIVKELKKTAKEAPEVVELEEGEPVVEVKKLMAPSKSRTTIKAFDFLKQRVQDISAIRESKTQPVVAAPKTTKKVEDDFELEIFIGEEKTGKKLMNVVRGSPSSSSSSQNHLGKILTPTQNSPNFTTRAPVSAMKRKIDEVSSSPTSAAAATAESEKEKKRKLIDDIINIKSKYSKEANDPEKNAHLKSYLDRLEEKESVENRLCSIKKKDVRVVTCNICKYTSFSQSDLCKSKRHDISRHMAVQRYFKCKNCNKRTYTLDKPCPVSSCMQCGSDKFEACGMKNEVIEKTLISDSIIPA